VERAAGRCGSILTAGSCSNFGGDAAFANRGDLRVSRSRAHRLQDPAAGQPGLAARIGTASARSLLGLLLPTDAKPVGSGIAGPIGLHPAPYTLLTAMPGNSIASSTRSVSVAANGQYRPAAATRSSVSATVLRATLSDRAISRSLAPHSCFRHKISRTRRIDTLSADIGPPLVMAMTSRAPSTAQRSSACHPSSVADVKLEWPRSSRNQWPTSFRNRWPTSPGIRIHDQLFDGRKIRVLTVVDTFTRLSPAIEVRQQFRGADVVDILERVSREIGYPKTIRVDNGPEFISKELDLWAFMRGVTLDFTRPGKPTDNAFIESLNGKFRAECLNANWFLSLDEARRKCEAWRRDYNEVRPHSAIGNQVPAMLHRSADNPGQAAAR